MLDLDETFSRSSKQLLNDQSEALLTHVSLAHITNQTELVESRLLKLKAFTVLVSNQSINYHSLSRKAYLN